MSQASTFAHLTCILQLLYFGKSRKVIFQQYYSYILQRLFTLSQKKQTATVVLQLVCLLTVI